VRVKLSSVAFLKAAGGYGIRLDDDGLLIEFLGDWRALEALREALGAVRSRSMLTSRTMYVLPRGW
jgi:hypothetical protein